MARKGKPKVSGLIQLYELPHLFGFWIDDPEQHAKLEVGTKEKWMPRGCLFLGDHFMFQLDLDVDDEEPDRMATYVKHYVYEIDGPDLILQYIKIKKGGERERGPVGKLPWLMTSDGRLNLQMEDFWWRYVPATVDDLVAAGFNRGLIEEYVSETRKVGQFVEEIFTVEKARELIKAARAKEEAEN